MGSRSDFRASGRLASVLHALDGLRAMLREEPNARLHLLATLGVLGAGLAFRVSAGEWVALALAVVVVWVAEAFNTAYEALCDVVSPERHPRVKRCKDVAAAGVLCAAAGALLVGALVFGPRLFVLVS